MSCAPGVVELLHIVEKIGQLHRAVHARMAGENLLEQCRPRARHTHDKNRSAVVVPRPAPREVSTVEAGPDALSVRLEVAVIKRTLRTSYAVCTLIVPKGLLIPRPLLAGTAERKMQTHEVPVVRPSSAERVLKSVDFSVAEVVILQIRKTPPGRCGIRIAREALFIDPLTLRAPSHGLEYEADRKMQQGDTGI